VPRGGEVLGWETGSGVVAGWLRVASRREEEFVLLVGVFWVLDVSVLSASLLEASEFSTSLVVSGRSPDPGRARAGV